MSIPSHGQGSGCYERKVDITIDNRKRHPKIFRGVRRQEPASPSGNHSVLKRLAFKKSLHGDKKQISSDVAQRKTIRKCHLLGTATKAH